MSSILKKIVPVMYISERHGIFYNFSSSAINVKNKDKEPFFIAHFHKVFRPRPLTPFDLHFKFCTKWKALSSYIILEPVLVLILDKLLWQSFWTYFGWFFMEYPPPPPPHPPICHPVCTKASTVMQLN